MTLGAMSNLGFTRDTDLVLPTVRTAQEGNRSKLPADALIVSADTHWSISEDLFYDRFPSKLKDQAPRVWLSNGLFHIGFDGKSVIPDHQEIGGSVFDTRPGSTRLDARLADMDAEGVDKEIVFGNLVNALMFVPDFGVRETALRIYNEYLAELQSQAPNRFYGVGFINYWDTTKTESSIAELKALGLKTFLLPLSPGKDTNGRAIEYCGVEMDEFWNIVENAGLPVVHHIGEAAIPVGRNNIATFALQNFSPFRKMFGEYTFGGILDRNPRLKVGWIEAGLNWALSAMQDASFIYASFRPALNHEIQKDVPEYWRDHMFASFMYDPLGLEHIDRIGVERALWASDYPHAESTLGYGWDAMSEVLKAVPEADAKKILGGNAARIFDLA